jgi:hypothetical protein
MVLRTPKVIVSKILSLCNTNAEQYWGCPYVCYLIAASTFSRNVGEIETKHKGEPLGSFYEDILSNSIATVYCSVASIEAYVNEVLMFDKRIKSPELKDCARVLTTKTRILEKYDGCLRLLQCKSLQKCKFPYQDVQILISLRNALTHFIPEWENQQDAHDVLSKKLRAKVRPRSPFFSNTDPIFPKAWATHSCTLWAVRSSRSFTELFEEIAEIPKRLHMFNSRIQGSSNQAL